MVMTKALVTVQIISFVYDVVQVFGLHILKL